jgi:hypothetical protein
MPESMIATEDADAVARFARTLAEADSPSAT